MSKTKPILLFFENLVEPIQTTKAEFEQIQNELSLLDRAFLRNGVFAYVFALFESTLSECLKRFLKEIPSKIPIQDAALKKHKNELVDGIFTYKVLESWIDEYIVSLSYGTAMSFIDKLCEFMSIANVSGHFLDSLNEKKERRNLLLHNNLVVNNKYIENTRSSVHQKGSKLEIKTEYLDETINDMNELFSVLESEMSEKYSKFTRTKAIKDIWNYIFNSPILRFEEHWIFKNNEIIGYNTETVKKWVNNFSHSEKILLALFLQNFSPGIVDSLFGFKDLPMFASVTGDKIAYIVEVFEKYPLLLQNSSKRV